MEINNPYKGLFQYTAADEDFFFGREKETTDLLEMIKKNQLVVLYGESGTGKTSLINAKLFPELKRQYYFPIYIRINFHKDEDPLLQTIKIINEQFKKWDETITPFSENLSLIKNASNTIIFNGLVKPVLFFDQFEEIFTLGEKYVDPKLIDNFITQIADLIEVRQVTNYTNESDVIATEKNNENILNFTVVISMRQDFIAQLDDLRFKIPSITSYRYRIKKFDTTQALDAIILPANQFNANHSELIVDHNVAHEILNQLKISDLSLTNDSYREKKSLLSYFHLFSKKGIDKNLDKSLLLREHKVEYDTTILSLYCHQLYDESKEINQNNTKKITLAQVKKSPCDTLIANYYNNNLSSRKTKRAIESYLITPDGRRVLLPLRDFLRITHIDEKIIQDLIEKSGIIRVYGKNNERDIELAHDKIAKQALISRRYRESNKILLITGAVSLLLLMLISLTYFYINQQSKLYDVQNLRDQRFTLIREKYKSDSIINKIEDSITQNEARLIKLKLEYENSKEENQYRKFKIIELETSLKNYAKQNSILQIQIQKYLFDIRELKMNKNCYDLIRKKDDSINQLIKSTKNLINERNDLSKKLDNYLKQIKNTPSQTIPQKRPNDQQQMQQKQ